MLPRGECLAMAEGFTILRGGGGGAMEFPLRNGFELNRQTLDLNVHAFDLSDLRLFHAHAAAASALFFTPNAFPVYYHLPFPPPPPPSSDLWHQQLRDYWSSSWHSYQFYKPQPSPKHSPPSFPKQTDLAVVDGDSISSHKSDSILPLPPDSAPKPSPDLYAKYVIESPAWLPPNWITEVQTRRTGTTAGTRDKYFKDPVSGRRFRSRNEVYHFLETGKGRVRKRYRRRIMNPDRTTDAACIKAKVSSPAGNATTTDAGCQPVSSVGYSRVPEPHIVNKDVGSQNLSVAIAIPPAIEKLPQQPPTAFPSSAPEPPAHRLPPEKPKACLKPATISRKRRPQNKSQKAPVKKKVRFESAAKDVGSQDSKVRLWLQSPVGPSAPRNRHQEKKQEQRLEGIEATVTVNQRRPKELARCRAIGKEQQAGLKHEFSRKNAKVAIDEELLALIQKPGLTSRQRARLVQKFKAKRAKQLLATLGRKICYQLLGLHR